MYGKADLMKIVGSIDRDSALTTLISIGVPTMFLEWIKVCITIPSFSSFFFLARLYQLAEPFPFMILKSQATHQYSWRLFSWRKGLRQGNPPSPYLRVPVMEVLSSLLNAIPRAEFVRYHPSCSRVQLTNLCFTNDLRHSSRVMMIF